MNFTDTQMLSMAAAGVFAGLGGAAWQVFRPEPSSAWGAAQSREREIDPLAPPVFPLVFRVVLAVICGLLGFAASGLAALGFVGAWFGWTTPVRILEARYERVLWRCDTQLVALVRMLQDGLLAGLNVQSAVRRAALGVKAPLQREVELMAVGLESGLATVDVFAHLARRVDTVAARRLSEAVALGHRFGGPLHTTLERLDKQMADQHEAQEKRRARVTGTKRQGTLIGALVPVMVLVYLLAMGPDVNAFYHGLSGTLVLLVVGGIVAGGTKWMKKITGDRVEARTHG